MKAELERRLREIREITGQLLPIIDSDDRAVRALMDDGRELEIAAEAEAEPLPPEAVRVAVVDLPAPTAYRVLVNRDGSGRITSADVVPLVVEP
jgi:hypothetical protein